MASFAIISMHSYSSDFLPGDNNLFTRTKGSSASVGEVGALPGVPKRRRGASSKPRGKPAEKERFMRRYDRLFAEMQSLHGPRSRMEILEKMKPMMYELSPDIRAWTGDVRIRIYLLMQEIAKDLDNPTYARASLGLLVLILSNGGNSAVEMARPILGEKIQAMHGDARYESERFLPRLLLMLDGLDSQHIEKLAGEAIHTWSDDRFRASGDFLGLEVREKGLRNRVKGILGGEIAKTGNAKDMTALNRAVELYHAAK